MEGKNKKNKKTKRSLYGSELKALSKKWGSLRTKATSGDGASAANAALPAWWRRSDRFRSRLALVACQKGLVRVTGGAPPS